MFRSTLLALVVRTHGAMVHASIAGLFAHIAGKCTVVSAVEPLCASGRVKMQKFVVVVRRFQVRDSVYRLITLLARTTQFEIAKFACAA